MRVLEGLGRRSGGSPQIRRALARQRKVDGLPHDPVSDVVWVQVVAGAVGGQQAVWVGGVADGLVEIDDTVKGMAVPDPGVDREPFPLSSGRAVSRTLDRGQRAVSAHRCGTAGNRQPLPVALAGPALSTADAQASPGAAT